MNACAAFVMALFLFAFALVSITPSLENCPSSLECLAIAAGTLFDQPLILALLVACITVVGAIYLHVNFVFSHRIFGPIYRIEVYLDALLSGEPQLELRLRRGDEFQSLAQKVTQLAAKAGSLRQESRPPVYAGDGSNEV
jgi:hypothetical protein